MTYTTQVMNGLKKYYINKLIMNKCTIGILFTKK